MTAQSMYSERSLRMKPSFIREILKAANQPGVISFAGGLPNTNLFPAQEIALSTQKVLSEYGNKALQYSTSEGLPQLKEWIAEYYKTEFDMDISIDEILITNGAQQGLDLISRTFINKGDKVLMEDPGYLGAINTFESNDADLIGLPIKSNGPQLDELERILTYNPEIKLFYSVPSFQNPSGACYSEETRKEISKAIRKHNILFIEDDPYAELSFTGTKNTPIKKWAGDNGILLGSFSKTLSPGMRIGWVIAQEEIIKALTKQKQCCDLHTSTLNQYIIYQYLKDYDFKEHIEKLRRYYENNLKTMTETIHEQLWTKANFEEPKGGLFLWLELSEGYDIHALLYKSISRGLLFVPGNAFMIGNRSNGIRLNYSNSTQEDIIKGIGILKEILEE